MTNYWLKYDRSGKHATDLKCLLGCQYVKHIDNWNVLKVNGLMAVLTFIDSKWQKLDSYWRVEKCLLIMNDVNLALVNKRWNVSQQ